MSRELELVNAVMHTWQVGEEMSTTVADGVVGFQARVRYQSARNQVYNAMLCLVDLDKRDSENNNSKMFRRVAPSDSVCGNCPFDEDCSKIVPNT